MEPGAGADEPLVQGPLAAFTEAPTPGPDGSIDLLRLGRAVTPEMARAAVERLDETLTPRFEGFDVEG